MNLSRLYMSDDKNEYTHNVTRTALAQGAGKKRRFLHNGCLKYATTKGSPQKDGLQDYGKR